MKADKIIELIEISKKYKTQKEWRVNDIKSYNYARTLKIMKICSTHMTRHKEKPDVEKYKEVIFRYETLKEFRENESKLYQKIIKKGLKKELLSHLIRSKLSPLKEF